VAIDALALLTPATGIARYTRELVRHLLSLTELHLWLHGLGWRRDLSHSAVPTVGRLKALFDRVVPRRYEVLRAARQLTFTLGAARRRIELYHAPNFLPLNFSGPTVVTVHDLSFLRYPTAHPAERVRVLTNRLPKVLERAQFVFVDSEFVRREVLQTYALPPDKVITTYMGVSDEFQAMSESAARPVLERRGLKYGKYVLSVGTLEPRKNLAGTLEAYAMLPPAVRESYPLAVVGMSGWNSEELSDRLAALCARGEVRPLGYVADADLAALYAGAAVFVYPSIYEGFGLPVLEALACGAPVVTSNRSSLDEIAGNCAAKVDPEDHAAISAALHRALEDRQSVRAESERRVQWARSFTWARCAEQTAAVYRRALKNYQP
jgi:glycosyltransferase involved in cell wall biosynthesis